MKLTKRILSLLMAVLMLCSGMAVTAFAANELVDYELNIEAKTLEIEKLVDNATDWNISFTTSPATVAAPTLLTETEEAFFYCNLVYGTTYTATVVAVIDGASSIQTLNIKLLKQANAPAAPVPKKVTSTTIEIGNVSGCEYRIDGGAWGSKTVFENLAPGSAHTIEMRTKETSTTYASPASSVTVKTLSLATKGIPEQPVFVDKTNKTITVMEIEGVEFSIDNGKTWQESGEFTGLKSDTTYPIIARYTFDETVQEPNPACAPVEIRTNTRASYPAELKNCKFTASEGENYANQSIAISVTADVAANYYDTQYGDTKYVPAYFTVGSSTVENNFTSSDGKVFKASFVPGESNANTKLAINVYFNKMKCIGEDENGDAKWVVAGEIESKTYYVNVGENYTIFTDVRNFFLQIFDFLFNALPGAINDLIKDFDLAGTLEGLNDLFKALEGVDLGGLTGGATA